MIKGPLGLLIFLDTMNDKTCVQPEDLITLDQKLRAKEADVVKEAA